MDGQSAADERGAGAREPDRGLNRGQRITNGRVFKQVFDTGRRATGSFLVAWAVDNGQDMTRVGVVASRRLFPRAVERSRAKRLLREAFRLNRWRLRQGKDVVLVARRAILGVKCGQVESDLLRAASKTGLMKED